MAKLYLHLDVNIFAPMTNNRQKAQFLTVSSKFFGQIIVS